MTATILGLLILYAVQQGWFENTTQQVSKEDTPTHFVKRFIDGDTLAITINGNDETVRIIGVDTPETHRPNTPVQCYGLAAAAYTKNLISNQKIRLEADPYSSNRDRYGRLLRHIYLLDNRLLAHELISNGYGFAYTQFPFTKSEQFITAENAAKAANKGLWGNCTVTVNTNGRKQTNDLSQ